MHIKLRFLAMATLIAVPAAAQDPYDRDPRLVIRETVRDVIRGPVVVDARAYQGRDRGPEQTEKFSKIVKDANIKAD